MRRKLIKHIILIAIFSIAVLNVSISVFAASVNESESNNTFSTADTIVLGDSCSGNIGDSDDKDYYKITPTSNGYINLNFKHTYANSDDDWNIYTYVYSNGEYTELSSTNINLNESENVSLPSIGAKVNGVYYVMVERCCSGVVGKNYTITTSFNSSNYYEKELNDVFGTATDISLGSSYTGTINNYYDKDYYKITPTSNGFINLNFKHTYANSDDDWNIYTYVYSNGEYTELSSTNINLNENGNVSLPSIGAKANGVYYVMVERCCSGVVGKNYTITTAYVCSSHSYTTKITQAGLTSNGKIVKTCSKCGYTKTETIYAAKTIKLSATKYTYDGKVKKPSVTIKDSKGNAIASSNYTITYPSGRKNVGKYTVKVTFKGNYSGSKNLTFTINPPKTSISKVTAGKKAFTVKWAKKTTQVTGYEIQYSTSSSFKSGNKTVKVTSAKTASKTIKSLKAKRKYYVRIRTYKTVGKTPYYSDWSAKKSVTT